MEYLLIGKDLSKSHSKVIHELISGKPYELRSIETEREVLDILSSDFKGLNVTNPYKTIVANNCDILTTEAKATGTVNTVIKENGKLVGYNTDVFGFEYLLSKYGFKIKDKKCLILGDGATSRTVEYVLNKQGASKVLYYTKDAKELPLDVEVIVNTTPVGSSVCDQQDWLDLNVFTKLDSFIDVVYNPYRTNACIDALNSGVKTAGGLPMLVAQAVKAEQLFKNISEEKYLEDKIYKQIVISAVNIVLIGHPLAGKSTIGEQFSKLYGLPFIDLDQEIIKRENGLSIEKIFKEKGEEYFRQIESELINEYSNKVGYIISLGGGAVLNQKNIDSLRKNSIIFNISRPLDLIKDEEIINRPLTKNKAELELIKRNRKALYKNASDYKIYNYGSKVGLAKWIWRLL